MRDPFYRSDILTAGYDARAMRIFDPVRYGAVRGLGVSASQRSKNTVAINKAGNDAIPDGQLVMVGDFECDPGIIVECHLDGSRGHVHVNDTSSVIAFLYGSQTDLIRQKRAIIPEVRQQGKVGLGWTGNDTGIKIMNVMESRIEIMKVRNFSRGIRLGAVNAGRTTYNKFTLGFLDTNQIQLHIKPDEIGTHCNQNEFSSGRFFFNSAEGVDVVGTRNIMTEIDTDGISAPNNLTFIGASLEGDTPEFHAHFKPTRYLQMINCRWEATTPKVLFDELDINNVSRFNVVWGGNDSNTIVLTHSTNSPIAENVVKLPWV